MRIIRTEMYFEEAEIIGQEIGAPRSPFDPDVGANPGLAFAWIKADIPGPFNIGNYKWFRGSELPDGEVGSALDYLLRGGDGLGFRRWQGGGHIENRAIVDFIFEQPIILEQSPPKAVPFKDLLKKSNGPLWIGTMMGYSLAGNQPALLFLTVPGGIIVVSTAWGVAEAVAMGLNKRLKRLFEGR